MSFFGKKNTFSENILLLVEIYLLLRKNYNTMETEKIKKVIKNIKSARTKKGYTYENMAHELSITPAAYRKIETGKTKLTVERLFMISEILSTYLSDLLEVGNVLQQINHENAVGYQQQILNSYQDNKEVYEKLFQSKEEQITLLNSFLEKEKFSH